MTARSPSPERIKQVVATLRELGLGERGFDIRTDGVTVFPPNESRGSAYDAWKAKDKGGDQAAHRP